MAEAPAPAWRVRLLQRVVGAEEHLRDVHERLVALEANFRLPLSAVTTEPEPGPVDLMSRLRLGLDNMMGSLRSATQILNSAIVYMEAAEILALHGGNVNPLEPLPSIHHLGQHHAAVVAALIILKNSQEMAKSASRIVQWSRGHLSMVIALLHDPAIPNPSAQVREEYNTAHFAILGAIHPTQTALAEATIARQGLTP